jgi:hypothetical protein
MSLLAWRKYTVVEGSPRNLKYMRIYVHHLGAVKHLVLTNC